MVRNFKRDWILYNSFASIGCMFTVLLWPISATIFVIIAQVLLLKRFVGWRSLFWVLNPPLVFFSFALSGGNLLVGVVTAVLMLELVFSLTIRKFSYMIWSLIVGAPAALYVLFVKHFDSTNDAFQIVAVAVVPIIIWYLEAEFLNVVLNNDKEL